METDSSIEINELPEIKLWKDQNGGKLTMGFFNNFEGNLPGGYRTEVSEEILKTKFKNDRASELLRSKTFGEFYKDCADVCDELGINEKDILKVSFEWQESKWRTREQIVAEQNFVNLLLPIYVRLRQKGYKHTPDLTG